MKSVLTVALLTLTVNVSAACPVKRPGDAPAMPDGAVASAEQMRKAQREAEKYLLQAEAYMECEVMNRRQHEALADKMDELSERYNEEMIKYQVRTSFAAGK